MAISSQATNKVLEIIAPGVLPGVYAVTISLSAEQRGKRVRKNSGRG